MRLKCIKINEIFSKNYKDQLTSLTLKGGSMMRNNLRTFEKWHNLGFQIKGNAYLIIKNKKIIAWCLIYPKAYVKFFEFKYVKNTKINKFHCFSIFVKPFYRNQKIGTRLVKAAKRSYKKITVSPWNNSSKEFFNKMNLKNKYYF
jgi:GNAT superfamily N-acetyltransferase